MKKLLIPILLFSSLALKAQKEPVTPTTIKELKEVTIKVTPAQADLLLRGLGEMKLSESIDLYISVLTQVRSQLNPPPPAPTTTDKKDSKKEDANKEEPKK